MLNLNQYGKRTRNNLTDQTPNLNAKRSYPAAPRGPPTGSNIPVRLRTNQAYQMTNNTTSILIFAKPFSDKREQHIVPGTLLFTCGGKNRMSTVLNLPQMNDALADSQDNGNLPQMRQGTQRASVPKGAAPHNCVTPWIRSSYNDSEDYYFFGIMRNEANSSKLQRLLNADVFGRAKISNIFGRNLRRGDRLGMILLKKTRTKRADGSAEEDRDMKWQWVPTVNGRVAKHLLDESNPARLVIDPQRRRAGVAPPANQAIVPTSIDIDGAAAADVRALRERMFGLGVVSHAVSEKPTVKHMCQALEQTDMMNSLPQVEILMV